MEKQFIHQRVYDIIFEIIHQPKYADGSTPIPKEVDLAHELGVSRETVRKAILNLVNENYLIRKKRFGTVFNCERTTLQTQLKHWSTFHDDKNQNGQTVKEFLKQIKLIDLTLGQQEIFQTSFSQATQLHRVMGTTRPEVFFQSVFNPNCELFKSPAFLDSEWTSLYEFLESNNIHLTRSEETITAVRCTTELSQLLKISDLTTPILKRVRYVYAENQPIEINIGYYNAELTEYSLVINR